MSPHLDDYSVVAAVLHCAEVMWEFLVEIKVKIVRCVYMWINLMRLF